MQEHSSVINLRNEAIMSSADILKLLRETLVISKMLKLEDIVKWTDSELKGYPENSYLPSYRKINGYIVLADKKGWTPMGTKQGGVYINQLRESIPQLLEYYKNKEDEDYFVITFSAKDNDIVSRDFPFTGTYGLKINKSYIKNIIDNVQNNILDWATTLISNNILGPDLRFSEKEIKDANDKISNTNYIVNVYGSTDNTQIQQNSTDTSQYMNKRS